MPETAATGLEAVLQEEARRLELASGSDDAGDAAGALPRRRGIGLALSGGGIRSATFSLGVLQALAADRRLAAFDYLSTVSGGGYIGSWLSAWIHRAGFEAVQRGLGRTGCLYEHGAPMACEPPEVTWLRRYSNYLTPRVGLLSLDSLTLVATWSRNFALNLVVLLGFLTCIFTAPHLLLPVFEKAGSHQSAFGFAAAWAGLQFFVGIGYNLWHQGLPIQRRRNWMISTRGVVATVMVPGVLTSIFGAIWLFGSKADKTIDGTLDALALVSASVFVLFLAWWAAEAAKRRDAFEREQAASAQGGDDQSRASSSCPKKPPAVWKELIIYLLAAGVSLAAFTAMMVGFYAAWRGLDALPGSAVKSACLLAWGAPAFLGAFGIATTIFTGLVGRLFFERSREWWSRLNAWLVSIALGWAAVGTLTFLSLPLLEWLASRIGGWLSLLGTGWIGSLFATIFLRKPESGPKKTQRRVDGALNVAASIFVAGLIFVVAAGTQWSLLKAGSAMVEPAQGIAQKAITTLEIHDKAHELAFTIGTPEKREASVGDLAIAHLAGVATLEGQGALHGLNVPTLAFLGLLAITLLFGWRVDINKFSLHNMYKNRLVRCYLGASNRLTRNEQPFTGLDDADDFPMKDLGRHIGAGDGPTIQRPFHIINTTLNITQGSNLAWQERKAASFVFTPLYCGYSLARTQGDSTRIETDRGWEKAGFRPTELYATRDREEPGFKLGMALATSGAAISPNMGHASRPARAFVLTLFNVRLGRWSGNPARPAWELPSPRFGLIPLLLELLGYSTENRSFVYLSDGGHFDNLGVYELVRRRCSTIFVVDAGADATRAFGDLADTIRKCRTDMGVDIEFPHIGLLAGDQEMRSGMSFAEGVIHYEAEDPSRNGKIILIKPSMARSSGEPVDVLNYAAENAPFPQQTTTDQFFDESQFESYRRLGLYITRECLSVHGHLLPRREPHDEPPPVRNDDGEAPTSATCAIAKLLRALKRQDAELPLPTQREGALVDLFVLLVAISLVFLAAFLLLDPLVIGRHELVCFRARTCREGLEAIFRINAGGPEFWRRGLFWHTMADNLNVIVYAFMFVSGSVVGTASIERRRVRNVCRAAFWSAVVCLACADYAENFSTLSQELSGGDPPAMAEVVWPFTCLKFHLAVACGAGLLALLPRIAQAFRKRWEAALAVPWRWSR